MTALRPVLFQFYFAIVTVVMCGAWLPSLLGPTSWVQTGIGLWGKAILWGLKVICGLTWQVHGREHIKTSPALYAGKHQSMWDTIVIPVLLDRPALVLKRQLLSIPFYGWYAQKAGMVAIDREGHASALKKMVAEAKDCLTGGRPIVIYPEGTRKKPHAVPDDTPGVAALYGQLDVPCVPFALNSGVMWQGWRRRPGVITISFLEAIPPGLKRKPFMERLETLIETETNRLVTEVSGA
jgi:1-acyl-sn-glycerol-3-phosphate acyltransferase